MASVSETGHTKNVAHLDHLNAFVNGYGGNYNPAKSALKLTSLVALHTTAQGLLDNVIQKNTSFNNALNDRSATYSGIKTLCTRLINALEATDAANETIKDAKALNRKIQGGRKAVNPATPIDPNTPAPKTISVSQQSYDQLAAHFSGIIAILSLEPSYAPNETDLKVSALTALHAQMMQQNANVAMAYAAVSNARIDRDKTLYAPETGLVDIAGEVKKYVKSVFGATSPEYGLIKGIKFKSVKQ